MMMRLSFVRVDVSSGTIGKASSTLNVYAALIHTTHSCVYAHNYNYLVSRSLRSSHLFQCMQSWEGLGTFDKLLKLGVLGP